MNHPTLYPMTVEDVEVLYESLGLSEETLEELKEEANQNMDVRIIQATTPDKKDVLHIELELETPKPSGSGKNLVVASTHGIVATTAQVNGKTVKLGVNAFISAR